MLGFRKEVEKWLLHLQQVAAISYMVVVAETWDALDRDHAMRLIDKGLAEASREREIQEGAPLADDWEARTETTVYNLVRTSLYAEARSYLSAQPAYARIASLERLADEPDVVRARVKRREIPAYQRCARFAWDFGIALGILDLLGEVPRTASASEESAHL